MLIEVDESIIGYVSAGGSNAGIAAQAFENLAIAHRKGLHIVTAKPAIFQWLFRNLTCTADTRATLQKLTYDASQSYSLTTQFNARVVAVSPELAGPRSCSAGGSVAHVPIALFADFDACRESLIIAENSDDIAVYIIFGRAYLSSFGGGSLAIKVDRLPGGGSTTAPIFKGIKDRRKRFCLCFVDSDKQSPNDAIGDTARQVLNVAEANDPMTAVCVLEEHELENLLPLAHLKKIFQGDHVKRAACDSLTALKNQDPVVYKFSDIKAGISLKWIFDMSIGGDRRAFWESKINSLTGIAANQEALRPDCIAVSSCMNPAQCFCVAASPLGTHLLSDFTNSISTHTSEKIRRLADSSVESRWLELGRVVFEWGCGTQGFTI